jgi:hypothetical protein
MKDARIKRGLHGREVAPVHKRRIFYQDSEKFYEIPYPFISVFIPTSSLLIIMEAMVKPENLTRMNLGKGLHYII